MLNSGIYQVLSQLNLVFNKSMCVVCRNQVLKSLGDIFINLLGHSLGKILGDILGNFVSIVFNIFKCRIFYILLRFGCTWIPIFTIFIILLRLLVVCVDYLVNICIIRSFIVCVIIALKLLLYSALNNFRLSIS